MPLIATPFNSQYATPQSGWTKDVTPYLNRALYITDMARIKEYREGFPSAEGLWRKIPWSLWIKPVALWMILTFTSSVPRRSSDVLIGSMLPCTSVFRMTLSSFTLPALI